MGRQRGGYPHGPKRRNIELWRHLRVSTRDAAGRSSRFPDRADGPDLYDVTAIIGLPAHMRNFALLSAACVCTLAITGCTKSASPDVAATVNSRPITYSDVDKHFQLSFPDAQSRPTDDQMTIQKLEILRTLIDNEILLQRAEKLSLMATDADVEAKFNELKSGYTSEDFQKQLDARKMTPADLKAQIRRDLSVQKVTNKEITSQIAISDNDITAFYNATSRPSTLPNRRSIWHRWSNRDG